MPRVPEIPTTLSAASVISGATVRGALLSAAAEQYNHIAGMGSALIPVGTPDITIAAAGTGITRNYVWPRYQCSHRRWVIGMGTASGWADVTVTFPSALVSTFRVDASTSVCRLITEPIVPPDRTDVAGEIGLQFDVSAGSTGSAILRMFGCYELGRRDIGASPSDDAGVSAESLLAGWPIYDGSATGSSLVGVASMMELALDTARRTGLFSASPYFTTTSGTFVSPLQDTFAVLGRKKYRTSTTAPMQVSAYCVTPVGTTGEVKFSMTSGDTVTLAVPSNTTGWIHGEVDIDCDDFTDAYGRRSTRFDKCTVEARRASGAGTVALEHVSAGEKRV